MLERGFPEVSPHEFYRDLFPERKNAKLLEKQSDTLTSVMKQKIRELEESKNNFFR